jgi:hypothetical protein
VGSFRLQRRGLLILSLTDMHYVRLCHVSAGRRVRYTRSPGAAYERIAAGRTEQGKPAENASERPLDRLKESITGFAQLIRHESVPLPFEGRRERSPTLEEDRPREGAQGYHQRKYLRVGPVLSHP